MSKNDAKIKDLLTAIESKKKEIGTKPRAQWKGNGLIRTLGLEFNLNTVNSTDKCVEAASKLLLEKANYAEACTFLGVKEGNSKVSEINDTLDDVKLRTQMILWDIEKKKLDNMEKKLKDLRSEDAKTEEALSDIEKALG